MILEEANHVGLVKDQNWELGEIFLNTASFLFEQKEHKLNYLTLCINAIYKLISPWYERFDLYLANNAHCYWKVAETLLVNL